MCRARRWQAGELAGRAPEGSSSPLALPPPPPRAGTGGGGSLSRAENGAAEPGPGKATAPSAGSLPRPELRPGQGLGPGQGQGPGQCGTRARGAREPRPGPAQHRGGALPRPPSKWLRSCRKPVKNTQERWPQIPES